MVRRLETNGIVSKIYTVGNLSLNIDSMDATIDGSKIELSKTEYLLLKCLVSNINVVQSRDSIINQVWGEGHTIDENAVDVYIRYLRSKIGDGIISTVRGVGYVIRSE